MRRALVGIMALVVAGCAAQPPERSPLPDVAEAVPPPLGCTLSVGDPQGVAVLSVLDGAAAAGILEEGDVITAIEDSPTLTASELTDVMTGFAPGDDVEVEYVSEGTAATATITLGANPDDTSRAMIGVTIRTAYDQIPLAEADDVVAPSQTARPIAIGDTLLLFDPLTRAWQHLGVTAPTDTRWISTHNGVYGVQGSGPAQIVDLLTDQPIPDDGFRDWNLQRLIGRVGEALLVVVTVPNPDQPGSINVAIAGFDPQLGETLWVSPVSSSFGVPVAAYGAPDGSAFIAIGADPESGNRVGIALVDSTGALQDSASLSQFGSPMGWFGPTTIGFRTDEDTVTVFDPGDQSSTPYDLAPGVTDSVIAPVGDGRHVISVDDRDMLLLDLNDPDFSIPLASNCSIGQAGDPGWGP